jgi:hypothetical protein
MMGMKRNKEDRGQLLTDNLCETTIVEKAIPIHFQVEMYSSSATIASPALACLAVPYGSLQDRSVVLLNSARVLQPFRFVAPDRCLAFVDCDFINQRRPRRSSREHSFQNFL